MIRFFIKLILLISICISSINYSYAKKTKNKHQKKKIQTNKPNKLKSKKVKTKKLKPVRTPSLKEAYVGLGEVDSSSAKKSFTKDFYKFNPGLNKWKKSKIIFPGGKRSSAVAFVINNIAYIGSGLDEGNAKKEIGNRNHKDFYQYDIENNKWKQISFFPQILRNNLKAFVINNNSYIAFGKIGAKFFNDVYKYNPKKDKWKKSKDLPISKYPKINFVLKNKLFFYNKKLYCYDFETKKLVSKKVKLPKDCSTGIYFNIENKAYIGLGEIEDDTNKTKLLSTVFYCYDAAKNKFTKIASFPGNVRKNAICFVIDKKGYVGLGSHENKYFKDIYEYDPQKNEWNKMADFPKKGRINTVTFVLNNKKNKKQIK